MPASAPAARSEMKYRSSVLMAASKTKWQSEQDSRWRLISSSTDVESRPSKYQQIKWIVSLQLISPVPQVPKNDHFPRQIKPRERKYYLPINQRFSHGYSNSARRACGNFLKRLHVEWFKCAESRQKIIIAEGLPSSPAGLGYVSPAGGGC